MKQITSLNKITSYLDKMMQDDMNGIMQNILMEMRDRIPKELPDVLKMSSSYKEIINTESDIHTQLGVPDIEKRFDEIFKTLSTFTQENVTFKPCKIKNGNVTAGFLEINLIPDDFKEVLESSFSNFTSITKRGANTYPWFGWLVQSEKSEYNPLIHGFRINYSFPQFSRTDNAIMLKAGNFSWSLPPEYSGTTRKNFITEVIDAQSTYLEKIFIDIASMYGN